MRVQEGWNRNMTCPFMQSNCELQLPGLCREALAVLPLSASEFCPLQLSHSEHI